MVVWAYYSTPAGTNMRPVSNIQGPICIAAFVSGKCRRPFLWGDLDYNFSRIWIIGRKILRLCSCLIYWSISTITLSQLGILCKPRGLTVSTISLQVYLFLLSPVCFYVFVICNPILSSCHVWKAKSILSIKMIDTLQLRSPNLLLSGRAFISY